jgi:serine/threonine-protein kinase
MIGKSLSRYELVEELGQGGMSTVYRGEDSALGRTVAVKVLHEHLAKKLENRERFRREARAIATLSHPNILDVYDFSSEDDDRSYIVMEYIPGHNLREFVDAHGTPPPEVGALICVEIAKALEHAHERGIIHRDLKPENVMISDDGEVKLMDFGIAHVIDAETMTKTGSLLGSPAHMAPELIDSGKVDERADIFSLGTVLYLLATGELPFCGSNAPQVLRAVMECRYDEPEFVEPKVGHRFGAIIERALHKDPDERYQTVSALRRDLLAAVHEVGIDDTEDELAAYFDDPEQHSEDFSERIIEPLTEAGKRAIEKKKVPEAMGFFNRVLAYEPDNEEVQQALARLNRDQRLQRIGRVAAAVLLVAAAGAGIWWMIPKPDPVQLSIAEASATLESGVAAAQTNATTATAVEEASRLVRATRQDIGDPATAQVLAAHVASRSQDVAQTMRRDRMSMLSTETMPNRQYFAAKVDEKTDEQTDEAENDARVEEPTKQAETVTYTFLLKPQGASLTINGEQYEAFEASQGIELEAGKRYRLTANHPQCHPHQTTFTAQKLGSDKPRPINLDFRDGRVSVTSNYPSLVYVNDSTNVSHKISKPGGTAQVDVDFGKASLDKDSKKVKIRVARADNMSVQREQTVEVRPGNVKELNFQFP